MVTARWAGLFLAFMFSVASDTTSAHAQGSESVAGLVILDEGGRFGFALVAFEEEEISGMELLRQSGAEPVTVSFGGLGEGVCGIGRTGCAVDVCRRRMCQTGSADSPYWQSFTIGADAAWIPLALGASADRVVDGDVRLWAWTAGEPASGRSTLDDISIKVGDVRNQIVWEGVTVADEDGTGSPLWLGIGLIGVAGVVAVAVTLRTRSRPA